MTARFKIIAGFGSVVDEAPTIETAMALARALDADIAGHFVEDTELLNLADLPFAKAVRPTDRSVLKVERSQMEREMARAALNWKHALYASASQARVRCSFTITRGSYSAEIARAGSITDLVIFNQANLSPRQPGAVSALLQRFERAAGAVVLPEERPRRRQGPVVVVATGAPGERGVFETAERIARTTGRHVAVLTVATAESVHGGIADLADAVFGSGADVFRSPGDTPSAGGRILAQLQPSFVVLQRSEPSDILDMVLQAGQVPIVLIRGAEDVNG